MAGEGHVYVPEEMLLERTEELLQVARQPLKKTLEDLARAGRVVLPGPARTARGVYNKPAWVAENGIAQDLGRLDHPGASRRPCIWRTSSARVQEQRGLPSPGAGPAVALALKDKLVIITGGPGTGKTTIVSCILDLYQAVGARVLLMAPTGRAAKRLSETTGA